MSGPRRLVWFVCASLALGLVGQVTGQRLQTFTDKVNGYKLKFLQGAKVIPPQPLEEQILAKWKATRKVKGYDKPLSLEVWVVKIQRKRKAAVTPDAGNKKDPANQASLKDQKRAWLNGGATVEEFLKRRQIRTDGLHGYNPKFPIKNQDKLVYEIQQLVQGGPGQSVVVLRTYFTATEADYSGLVFVGHINEFEKDADAGARSLQWFEGTGGALSSAVRDPYEDSKLPHIDRRREVRSKLLRDWKGYDTENFILVTNLVDNTDNRELVREILIELEVMREEYRRHFPPQKEFSVLSTVRVHRDFKQYMDYGAPPGSGGYWNFVDEELVLFDPNGTIGQKQPWMKKVSSKGILYHEAMHQYFHYSNGEMPPASWFNEGYGEYFGGSKVDRYQKKIRLIEKNAFRLTWIREAQKSNEWPNLEILLRMSQAEFYGRVAVPKLRAKADVLKNYAFGWAFCYFLEMERAKPDKERNTEWAKIPESYIHNLREVATEYRQQLPADAPKGTLVMQLATPIQKKAYERTFKGIDLAKLQAAWIEAMKTW